MARAGFVLFSGGFFLVVGPIFAPVNVSLIAIPLSYTYGAVPAFLAGLMFGVVALRRASPIPSTKTRMAWGAGCGALATFVCTLAFGYLMIGMAKALYLPLNQAASLAPKGNLLQLAPVPWVVGLILVTMTLALVGCGAVAGAACGWLFPDRMASRVVAQGKVDTHGPST